jgi:hypothetical protein
MGIDERNKIFTFTLTKILPIFACNMTRCICNFLILLSICLLPQLLSASNSKQVLKPPHTAETLQAIQEEASQQIHQAGLGKINQSHFKRDLHSTIPDEGRLGTSFNLRNIPSSLKTQKNHLSCMVIDATCFLQAVSPEKELQSVTRDIQSNKHAIKYYIYTLKRILI